MNNADYRAIFFILFFCLSACDTGQKTFVIQDRVVDPGVESQILEAIGFDILSGEGYTILQIFENVVGEAKAIKQEFLLLPEGNSVPEAYQELPLINIPIKSLITSSTTQVSLLNALDAEEVLVGHADRYIWDESLRGRLFNQHVATVGVSANLNTEIVLALNPDVYMSVAYDEANSFSLLTQAGIAILSNAEYLEPTLLGRAEWIKVMGLLVGKVETANKLFLEVRDSYHALVELTAQVEAKPLVILNSPFRGIWYVPGGKSYIAGLIQDAGGAYSWQHNEDAGSLVVSFEEMLVLGVRADIWINPVSENALLSEVLEIDSRLAEIKPYQSGEVYNFTKRVAANGANDYWESGVVFPDKILADLIKIFHPELLPQYELFYYQQLQ